MAHFTPEEIALLERYVSSAEANVFSVKGLTGLTGAVYARYSRAQGGFRETLLKEFVSSGMIDAARADALIQRVLIAYGDDSVGELEGAHVSFEDISILATKELEDRRIGGSPIEQSTRYVFYDRTGDDGRYRYCRPPEVMASAHAQEYVDTMDFIFATYCELIAPMKAFYEQRMPIAEAAYAIRPTEPGEVPVKIRLDECTNDGERKAFRQTYGTDVRTKACDSLRALLPVATLTNVGIFGNGRFFQHALTHCYSHPLREVRDMATKAHSALDSVMPQYVKRAGANAYAIRCREGMRALTHTLFAGTEVRAQDGIVLLDHEPDFLIGALRGSGRMDPQVLLQAMRHEEDTVMLACMLFPYLHLPLSQIRDRVRHFPQEMRDLIVSTYVGERQSRRDRPGRAFEAGYPYLFDLATDFGTFKDLERHRMCTQLRQDFSPCIGFLMPDDLVEAGFEHRVTACVEKAIALYARLLPDLPHCAAYATLHGSIVRWALGLNDRALHHLLELRTQPQGHASYRKAGQQMHRLVEERSPWRAGVMRFVDHNDYTSARGDAEARQRAKEAKLGLQADVAETDDE